MKWNYGIVKKNDGKIQVSEIFYNCEGKILAVIEVKVPITSDPSYNPEKASLDEVKANYFEEISQNEYIRIKI